MTKTNVFQLSQPGSFIDPLTEVLRDGARALLAQAVEAEVATLLSRYADETSNDGRQRLVRHGHLPEREIMTGIGPVAVRCPRVRDRVGKGSERIRFSSAILPPYARRSKSLEVLIPILYLKGVSTGDFEEALVATLRMTSTLALTSSAATSGNCSTRSSHPRAARFWPSTNPARRSSSNIANQCRAVRGWTLKSAPAAARAPRAAMLLLLRPAR